MRLVFSQKTGTKQMPITQVKNIVFRYIMTYYNRIRIYTGNPTGLPPAMYRQAASPYLLEQKAQSAQGESGFRFSFLLDTTEVVTKGLCYSSSLPRKASTSSQ